MTYRAPHAEATPSPAPQSVPFQGPFGAPSLCLATSREPTQGLAPQPDAIQPNGPSGHQDSARHPHAEHGPALLGEPARGYAALSWACQSKGPSGHELSDPGALRSMAS